MIGKDARIKELIKVGQTFPPEILSVFNSIWGISAQNLDEWLDSVLPTEVVKLRHLCAFYEAEMFRCAKADSHFAACIMGGAVVESFLALTCFMNECYVKETSKFKKNRDGSFEQTISRWDLNELIETAADLRWIPVDLVDDEFATALAEGYREIAVQLDPTATSEQVDRAVHLIETDPAFALMKMLHRMRNHIHGGRCMRKGIQLGGENQSEWFKLAMVATAEIRNCLLFRFHSDCKSYMTESLNKRLSLQ